MKQVLWAAVGLLGILSSRPASAQVIVGPRTATGPVTTPVFSPFLNLLRGGNPAVNYFGVVRPQQEVFSSILQLQQQQPLYGPQVGPLTQDVLPETGHAARFQNYSHYYYNNIGSQGTTNSRPNNIVSYPTQQIRR